MTALEADDEIEFRGTALHLVRHVEGQPRQLERRRRQIEELEEHLEERRV